MRLMRKDLGIKKTEIELKKVHTARLARADAREQKLVDLMELLVNHIVKTDSQDS